MFPCDPRRCVLSLTCWLAWTSVAGAADGPGKYLARPAAWFAGAEAGTIAERLVARQAPDGAWPKNVDNTAAPPPGKGEALSGTFDNGATVDEVRFLARRQAAVADEPGREAVRKAVACILTAQYPSGGWPQFYPPGKKYNRHITFNDGTMVGLLELLREIVREEKTYAFLGDETRCRAAAAFGRGIECITKCTIKDAAGNRTAWCAQHDEVDFSPRPARAFEPVSTSGGETVGIVRLLMRLDEHRPAAAKPPADPKGEARPSELQLVGPSAETDAAIEGAVTWLKAVKIEGFRYEDVPDPAVPGGKDRRLVPDPQAPPLWARFYELGTNRPIFGDRDGSVHYVLGEISLERRTGYAWYVTSARTLLERDYPAWKRRRTDLPKP